MHFRKEPLNTEKGINLSTTDTISENDDYENPLRRDQITNHEYFNCTRLKNSLKIFKVHFFTWLTQSCTQTMLASKQ